MNVLIVDDEILAIQGLLDDINWDIFEFNEILTANSYAQAVNIFLQKKVDILLCDIEMPFGSGLELVKWVKEHYSNTECIFLTCHSEFNFAKQAVSMQCLGYILKPADSSEVEDYLAKAQRLIKERGDNEMYENYGKIYLNNLKDDVKVPIASDVVEQVEEYIYSHISEPLNIEEIAKDVHVSSAHLGRMFRKKHNMSIIDYITEQRISLAKKLLQDGNITVSAASVKAGYNNYSYFTKIFKKCTGKTPREYVQEMRNKEML